MVAGGMVVSACGHREARGGQLLCKLVFPVIRVRDITKPNEIRRLLDAIIQHSHTVAAELAKQVTPF